MESKFNEFSFDNSSTRYVIQTTEEEKLLLYLNSTKMLVTLYELICWKNDIHNGRTYNEAHILYKGKLYNEEEWSKAVDKEVDKDDLDGCGFIKKGKTQRVYLEKDVLNILDRKLEDIIDFVYNYMK